MMTEMLKFKVKYCHRKKGELVCLTVSEILKGEQLLDNLNISTADWVESTHQLKSLTKYTATDCVFIADFEYYSYTNHIVLIDYPTIQDKISSPLYIPLTAH